MHLKKLVSASLRRNSLAKEDNEEPGITCLFSADMPCAFVNLALSTGFASLQLHPIQQSSVDRRLSEVEIFEGENINVKTPGRTAAVLVQERHQ